MDIICDVRMLTEVLTGRNNSGHKIRILMQNRGMVWLGDVRVLSLGA